MYRPAAFTGTNAGGSVAIRWDGGMEVITVPAFRCLRHEPHVKITGQPVVVDSPLASTSTDADELALEAMIRDEMAAGVK